MQVNGNVHVSAAILDIDSLAANAKKNIQVWVAVGGRDHLMANLTRQTPQFLMDAGFSHGEQLEFYIKGPGKVYLNGYTVEEYVTVYSKRIDSPNAIQCDKIIHVVILYSSNSQGDDDTESLEVYSVKDKLPIPSKRTNVRTQGIGFGPDHQQDDEFELPTKKPRYTLNQTLKIREDIAKGMGIGSTDQRYDQMFLKQPSYISGTRNSSNLKGTRNSSNQKSAASSKGNHSNKSRPHQNQSNAITPESAYGHKKPNVSDDEFSIDPYQMEPTKQQKSMSPIHGDTGVYSSDFLNQLKTLPRSYIDRILSQTKNRDD